MKAAIEVLTRFMAFEPGKRKIRVNVIAPSAIATDSTVAAYGTTKP